MNDKNFSDCLASKKDFDNWTLEKILKRPWGPGIMYEVVFYFAEHLGVSKIYTVGWDFEKPGTQKSRHYYNKRENNIIRPADEMNTNELSTKVEASKALHAWLKTKEIDLFVATENSYVHEGVPRVKIKEKNEILHYSRNRYKPQW